ncbi:response regulator transcription factor [Parabacteroides pacaensis]|uniref:response regulator transcription factor n=1 Tax=Parabacteroides pacaensis TaxID=2086575 RepID=UPI000D0FD32C|nr:LuxR C-terminal-related transcriptional regulator [Parabacteroides pacaensis]
MNHLLKAAIAEPSVIIRNGLETVLKKLPGLKLTLIDIPDMQHLYESLKLNRPDLLIVNPAFLGCFSLPLLKEECECSHTKCIALLYSSAEQILLKPYDEVIHLHDDEEQICHKLVHCSKMFDNENDCNDEQQCLSIREKEIVICVVKGMTNKEIAEKLYLSTHTVITHRRNIARKLQIHSASGLTIYAIVNKLVQLDDIKDR